MILRNNIFRKVFCPHTVIAACVAVLVFLVAGCASVNRLREAQDAFNQAAAAENTLRLESARPHEGSASDAPAVWSVSRNGYSSALLSLEKLDKADEKKLRDDGLWGTALTLKALSQWRLGLFSKALATAGDAQKNAGDQVYPRDRALLAALPGLIKTDQAYSKIIGTSPSLTDVRELLVGQNGAVADIQSARGRVDRQHPVQVYLVQAQLAAYRNLMVALDRLDNHATVPESDPARAQAIEHLKELADLLKAQPAATGGQDLVQYWSLLCALPLP
jgi:hypothetical protein